MTSVIQPALASLLPGGGVSAAGVPVGGQRLYNFSAGPGVLPDEVLRQVQHDVWNIFHSGVGILEHSHRGKVYDRVLAEAEADFRAIGSVPTNYKVLFMTGGATSQNYIVPMNLKSYHDTADYITTGYWAERSLEHAAGFGAVHEAFAGKVNGYSRIPDDAEIRYSAKPSYVHFCSNNTIYGTQWHEKDAQGRSTWAQRVPKVPGVGSGGGVGDVPVVCDMCSDMYSRPIDFSKFGVIYAGAQKNLGAAGVTVVVVREDLMERVPLERDGQPRHVPLMLQYKVQARDESRHNTPPVGPIYIAGLVFKWILAQGGLTIMAERNRAKAKIVYDVLDHSTFYTAPAHPDSRSLMNVLFRCPTPALDDLFVKEAYEQGLDALKGHRATGGMRASLYNAFPRAGAEALAQFMREFERKHG